LRALFLVLILLVVGKLSKILHVYWVIRYFLQLFKSLEIKLASKVLAKGVEEPVVTVVPLLSRAIQDVPLMWEVSPLAAVFLRNLTDFLDLCLLL